MPVFSPTPADHALECGIGLVQKKLRKTPSYIRLTEILLNVQMAIQIPMRLLPHQKWLQPLPLPEIYLLTLSQIL